MPDLQNQSLELKGANTISTVVCETCSQNSSGLVNQTISLKDGLVTSAATEPRQGGVTNC